jgi:hypothetical protein
LLLSTRRSLLRHKYKLYDGLETDVGSIMLRRNKSDAKRLRNGLDGA